MAYKPYQKGENEELDKALEEYGKEYMDAREEGDWQGMHDANIEANKLRNEYGYAAEHAYEDIAKIKRENPDKYSSGGGGGGGGGGFSYASAPTYTGKYDALIQDVANQIMNRPEFSYDPESDPTYQQYKEQYTKAGQRAMQDTLGEVSARTGGLASSYAGVASQQTYDNYMSELANKVPELKQLAYQMYQDEGDQLLSQLNMLLSLDDADYAKYQGLLGQYNADRAFQYGVFSDDRDYNYQVGRDQVSDKRYENEWWYQVGRDQIGDERYENEWNYGVQQDQYVKDAEKAALLAANGDFSGYASLWGLSDDQVKTLVDQFSKQQNLTDRQAAMELASYYAQYGDFSKLKEMGVDTSYLDKVQDAELSGLYRPSGGGSSGGSGGGGGGGSSGGGSSGGGSSGTSGSSDIYQTLYDSGIKTEGDAYAALLASGYNTTQSGKLAGYYMEWLNNRPSGGSDSDYENAEIEWGSVINLGYGPLNEDGLAKLESEGKIKSYISNGKIYFRRVEGNKNNNSSNSSSSGGALDWIFKGI